MLGVSSHQVLVMVFSVRIRRTPPLLQMARVFLVTTHSITITLVHGYQVPYSCGFNSNGEGWKVSLIIDAKYWYHLTYSHPHPPN